MDEDFFTQKTMTDLASPLERGVVIPRHIGPYKIESLLSRGGMGTLYLGLHSETRELRAIKVLSPEFLNHPEMIAQFLKEAQIIGMTSHPNIVKLYGQGQWEGGLYLVMEFIRGVSLRQFIVQQSLSLKRSIDIILQVAYALCHLHAHKVIHGDLKPENILMTEDGEVKVIDFGIARLHEDHKKHEKRVTKIVGTPNYMSPERKEDPSKVTFASDMYALGVIAYELAMGKLSFGVIHLSLLPRGLKKIIEKALAVSISERYADSISFISDLSQYLKSGGLERDRPGSDQHKELLETLQQASTSLSSLSLPKWTQIDMGIAKYKGPGAVGSYYEFFKLPDNSYLILIAETLESRIDSGVYLGVLRGLLKAALFFSPPAPGQSAGFVNTLNRFVNEDSLGQKFPFSLLLLNPLKEELSFISCGLGGLIHIPTGRQHPRKMSSHNPPLGTELRTEFFATTDNWEIGDTLIFHSLDSSLEGVLFEAVTENLLLSAQGQAEALLKKAATHSSFSLQKNPKVLFSLQRVG